MSHPVVFASSTFLGEWDWGYNVGDISTLPPFQLSRAELGVLMNWPKVPHPKGVQYSITFREGDCVTVPGSQNCSQACTDPAFLFTPMNLRMCLRLASTALLVKDGQFAVNLTDATRQATETWHVPNLTALDGAAILANISSCLFASCIVADDVKQCTEVVRKLPALPINASKFPAFMGVLGNYCGHLDNTANADIAGPGVFLSYIFQTSLSLLLYILVNFFTFWPGQILRLLDPARASLREKGERLQARLAGSRFGAAVISSLVEFQEVQLYFVGFLQIAIIVNSNLSHYGTGGFNSNSFVNAILNSIVATILGVHTVYAILLCQVCLQRERMHWWYTFVLMTVVFILALAINFQAKLMPPLVDVFKQLQADKPVPACGHNPSPMTYCHPVNDNRTTFDKKDFPYDPPGEKEKKIFAVVGVVSYVGLALDQLYNGRRSWYPAWVDALGRRGHDLVATKRAKKVWPRLRSAYWFSIQLALLAAIGFFFLTLLNTSPSTDIQNPRAWGFGQLIAVMVWAPTIVKYIYYNVFGIEGGFEERVSRAYTITMDDPPKGESKGLPAHQQDVELVTTHC